MYGFIDESGTPGVKGEKSAYLGVVLVFFDSLSKVENLTSAFRDLRKELSRSPDEEFHARDDKSVVHDKVLSAIATLDFHYAFCAIKKDSTDKHAASYLNISKEMMELISRYKLQFKAVKMDTNPTLKKYLVAEAKAYDIHMHCREVKSSSYDGVQLADYIVYMSNRKARGLKVNDKLWKEIEKKRLA